MRIHGWHIDGFGIHHDQQVTDLPQGLTVITGPNESGKTTLQHFLAGVLFGYPNKGRPDRHDPVNGGSYGGRLFVTDEQGRAITIHRGARKSSLRLATAEGDLDPAEAALADLVGGASKELFQSVFAVHLADLAELRALSADQVRERVFSAGIVGAGKTAEAALTELGAARDMLLRPSGRGAFLLKALREQLAAARSRLAEARAEADHLPDLLHQLAQLDAEAASFRAEARTLDQQQVLLQAVLQVWPSWVAAQEAHEELAQLGPVPGWDARTVTTLRDAVTLRAERTASLAAATRRLDEAAAAAAALPAPGPAAPLADAIARAAQQAHAEEQRRERIAQLRHRLAGHQLDVGTALARLGPDHDRAWLATSAPRIDDAAELRTVAAATDDARRAAVAATTSQRHLAGEVAAEGEALRHAAEQAAAATGPSAESAARYLDATARLVSLVGQRDAATRHLAAAAQRAEATRAPDRTPSTSGRPLAAAGALALVGAIGLAASGAVLAAVVALVVAIALVAAGAARGLGLTGAAGPAAPTAPDLLTAHATEELAQLDAELQPVLATLELEVRPTASQAAEIQSHAHRLAAAAHDREAAKRQTADVLEAQRRTADRRLAAAAAEVARTAADLADAEQRWTAWLASHHLPAALDPAGASEFLTSVERARTAAHQAGLAEADLAEAVAQSRSFADEVGALAQALGLDADQDALTQVELLTDAADRAVARTQALHAATAQVELRRADREQAITALDHADADLKALLGEAAVADADDALDQIERVEHARKLRATIAHADTRLAAALGEADHQIQLARTLLTDPTADPAAWATQVDQLAAQARTAHVRRDEALDRRSRLQTQVDRLSASADIPSLELDVTNLETQLVDAVRQWASFHLAHQLVEGTLARYQRERQPEVVQRAASLFQQVTDGRYARLEVRGTDVIAIDRSEREIPASDLSQGTTEQLYLCMRFALAESFAKTASLPLLLDDITVNADTDRLPRLAQMIATVAETHQVLVFSCQDRMVELLQQADPQARVITLPGQGRGTTRIGAVS
jgi:uncharacterized protein YhaN